MKTLESFYDFIIYDKKQKAINSDLLIDFNIKAYILEKLQQKAVNYPQFLNLNFQTLSEFERFNKNLIGEIYRLFLNIARAAKNYKPLARSKAEPLLKKAVLSYLDLKNCYTSSLNAVVSHDGKKTELGDLIPATSWETYELETPEETEITFKIKPKKQKKEVKTDTQPKLF